MDHPVTNNAFLRLFCFLKKDIFTIVKTSDINTAVVLIVYQLLMGCFKGGLQCPVWAMVEMCR